MTWSDPPMHSTARTSSDLVQVGIPVWPVLLQAIISLNVMWTHVDQRTFKMSEEQ